MSFLLSIPIFKQLLILMVLIWAIAVLLRRIGFGLFAELIGLHMILGAYLAGLFFREQVASKELIRKVEDRLYGIAYSFLGPIFLFPWDFILPLVLLPTMEF